VVYSLVLYKRLERQGRLSAPASAGSPQLDFCNDT
jgi:hypothetical protein